MFSFLLPIFFFVWNLNKTGSGLHGQRNCYNLLCILTSFWLIKSNYFFGGHYEPFFVDFKHFSVIFHPKTSKKSEKKHSNQQKSTQINQHLQRLLSQPFHLGTKHRTTTGSDRELTIYEQPLNQVLDSSKLKLCLPFLFSGK